MKKVNMIEKMKMVPISIFIGMALLIMSCGESVDPTKAEIKLDMKAGTQLSTINTNARVATTGIEFTQVLIGVTEIEFESKDGDHDGADYESNDGKDDDSDDNGIDSEDENEDKNGNHDDNEIEFKGQFTVDLLNGTSDPDFGVAEVLPGTYKEVKVKVSPIMADGNSIFIKLTYTDEGMDPVTVEISTTKEFKLKIENKSGIQLDGNALNQVLVLVDLDQLLAGLDLSTLEADSDGVIRINETMNSTVLSQIWSQVKHAFKAGEDHDHNDEIDDDHSDEHDTDDD